MEPEGEPTDAIASTDLGEADANDEDLAITSIRRRVPSTTSHVFDVIPIRFAKGVRKVLILATRVDQSGVCRVSAVADSRVETVARALRDHFERLGGVPDRAAFRAAPLMRRALLSGNYFKPSFAGALAAIGVQVGLDRSRALARLEAEVLATFLAERCFSDLADLERKLEAWCRLVVLAPAEGAPRGVLRPLSAGPDEFAVPEQAKVAEHGLVYVDGECYVVPERAGSRVRALVYPSVVRVVGRRDTLLERKVRKLRRPHVL